MGEIQNNRKGEKKEGIKRQRGEGKDMVHYICVGVEEGKM